MHFYCSIDFIPKLDFIISSSTDGLELQAILVFMVFGQLVIWVGFFSAPSQIKQFEK